MVVPVVPLASVPGDEPVLRADPGDRFVVPQPSQAPLLLAAVLALCVVTGLVTRAWWQPVDHAATTPPPPSALASPAPVPAPAARVTTAAPPHVVARAPAPVHRLAHPDKRPHVRHARARPPRPAHLQAGRRNGEGRA